MTNTSSSFYISGGTLPITAPSYVERRADYDLLDNLQQGAFCYVLTSRQMGKSSLMMRTGAHLREADAGVAILDLTVLGRNLTMEQWYWSLCSRIGEPLSLEEKMEAFWEEHPHLSPLQRWTEALRHVILEQCARRVVIFIDEIDFVRNLTFDTDEFFAAIRACYNRRAEDPAFHRLTFCLLGVALPSELIRNIQMTPFNIGRRVSLSDFTGQESSVLAERLHADTKTASRLLERILYWTGGHPYLTQKLCQAVAEENDLAFNASGLTTNDGVDRLCTELFLSNTVRVGESNLMFVANSILNSGQDVASLLDLYRKIWSGKRVADDEASLLVSVLKLSGIIRPEGGFLRIRNRIYARVFDKKWIQNNMPGAELRRQRAAYFLGLLRATSLFAIFLTTIIILGFTTFYQFRRAEQERAQRRIQEQLVEQGRHLNYAADMNLVQQDYERGDYGRMTQLLEAHRPKPGGKADLRGFEWRYYWRLMHQDVHTFIHPGHSIVFSVAFSPDGKILASANGDGTIELWDIATWEEMATLLGSSDGVFSLAFSPNGKWLAAGCLDKTVQVWDVAAQHVVKTLKSKDEVYSVAFSPDGRWLASGSYFGTLKIWDVATWHDVFSHDASASFVTFSQDSRWLASGEEKGKITLWEVATWRKVGSLPAGDRYSLAWSTKGNTLAVGGVDGSVEFWNVSEPVRKLGISTGIQAFPPAGRLSEGPRGGSFKARLRRSAGFPYTLSAKRKVATLRGHRDRVNGLAFSSTGRYLATGSWDGTIRLWEVATHQLLGTFIGHTNRVTSVAFAPDGRWLASGGSDEVKVWNPWHREENPSNKLSASPAWSPDNNMNWRIFFRNGVLKQFVRDEATKTVKEWDCSEQRHSIIYHAQTPSESMRKGGDTTAAYSSNGRMLAVGTSDGKVILSDTASGRQLIEPIRIDARSSGPRGVGALAFSADRKIMAAASGDPALVTIWDIASGRQIAHFMHSNSAAGIAFSPDGKMLAAANWQGQVYLLDLATGKKTVWWAHAKPVNDVVFSPDGKTLATASEDATVKLWNVATQREMVTLTGPHGPIDSVAFSADGNRLAALSDDKKVWVWKAASLAEADRER